MEATRFQNIAMDYQKKWFTATGTIREQRQEIDTLKSEITRLRREVYRLQDEHHRQTTTNGGAK